MMEARSPSKVGGISSMLVGVSYLLVGITFMFDYVRTARNWDEFWTLMYQYPTVRLLNHFFFVTGAIFALAAIPAISQLVRRDNQEWIRWATNIAFLGITVTAITHLQYLTLLSSNANLYVNGDELTKKVFLAVPPIALDGAGWLRYGGIGVWMLAVCLLALRHRALPQLLAYLGLFGAGLYIMIPLSSLLMVEWKQILQTVAAALGGMVVGPIWFIWAGLYLYRPQQVAAIARESELIVPSNAPGR
jgi:hypothetical protein